MRHPDPEDVHLPGEAVMGPDLERIANLAEWLVGQALGDTEPEELLEGYCRRLERAGIPILRAQLGYRILHPLYHGFTVIWERDGGTRLTGHLRTEGEASPEWLSSPYYHMLTQGLSEVRRRLTGPEAKLDFPILEEIRQMGGTDYFALAVPFVNDPDTVIATISADGKPGTDGGLLGSWTTDRDTGFSDADLTALRRLQRRLAVAAKMVIQRETAVNIVNAYLGQHAGSRVLDGTIHRGAGEDISAVIWFCDLHDSTPLADSMPRAEFLDLLNRFLETMAGAIHDQGGQVLRYIGDAALAIFPIEHACPSGMWACGPASEACRRALAAAIEARRRTAVLNDELNKEGRSPLGFSIGLHLGDITYGNIGSPERIEFTVIGAAANEAARIQAKCKDLGRWLVTSASFAYAFPEKLERLGRHSLRGVAAKQELFGLPDGDPAA